MPQKKKRKRPAARKHHILLILLLIAGGIFLLYEEFGREDGQRPATIRRPAGKHPAEVKPVPLPPPPKLPPVAIVIDDLGTNREQAEAVLALDTPITLSILPLQPHSAWTASEGKKRGYDVIVHLPMEAEGSNKLGPGGLYTWMSDDEISRVVEENLQSVPYSTGAGNHMGSAFTADKRAMTTVMAVLKKHQLFFIDSLTSPQSAGFRVARSAGVPALSRDVFLDDADDMREIEIQWNRMVKIARKYGSAIAIGHPRKNTLAVLERKLARGNEITVVPLSRLLPGR
ncbi:MAG: divergent polysaccharide deacetylase family protein [Nitrospiraceae bacterium]|nr:MAG: divergent polysaccharide deacetylase family protein [Nitrospiraceae bacterium]